MTGFFSGAPAAFYFVTLKVRVYNFGMTRIEFTTVDVNVRIPSYKSVCVCVRTDARRAAVVPSPTPGVQLEPAWTRRRSVTLLAATQERCLPLLQMSCSIILTTERKIYDMIPSSLSIPLIV